MTHRRGETAGSASHHDQVERRWLRNVQRSSSQFRTLSRRSAGWYSQAVQRSTVVGGDAWGNPDAPTDPSGVRSARRALDLLELFDGQRQSWSVGALVDACGLPKTTVIRLLATLEERGLLWHRRDGAITVGPGLLRWAGLARSTWEFPEAVVQVMSDLSHQCGETVNLYVRNGTARVCVAQRDGPQSLRHVV